MKKKTRNDCILWTMAAMFLASRKKEKSNERSYSISFLKRTGIVPIALRIYNRKHIFFISLLVLMLRVLYYDELSGLEKWNLNIFSKKKNYSM